MPSQPNAHAMKPATAAKKLGIYLEAAPGEFQAGAVTRAEFAELRENPPQWLRTLRVDGPHPRPVVAKKLGVSISGLARGGVTEALTTAEIEELLTEQPEWLVHERANLVQVRREDERVREQRATRREQSNRKPRSGTPFG